MAVLLLLMLLPRSSLCGLDRASPRSVFNTGLDAGDTPVIDGVQSLLHSVLYPYVE